MMNATSPKPIQANAHATYVITHGRELWSEGYEPNPDNCAPYDGDPEYLGHRLGQVVADSRRPDQAPVRISEMMI